MKKALLIALCVTLASCLKVDNDPKTFTDYADSFSTRRDVSLTIDTGNAGQLVSVYYENPYVEGDLVGEPALTGFTPISSTLKVPADVKTLYVMDGISMSQVSIIEDAAQYSVSRAKSRSTNITANVLQDINSIYFPEAKFNFRKDDLLKCTDIVVKQVGTSDNFETADLWITFVGDGGFHIGGQYGRLWMYTYPSNKMNGLTLNDCTFYGLVDGKVKAVNYNSDVAKDKNCLFYSKDELNGDVSSFKKLYLGAFAKGLNIGFAYHGTSTFKYSTPNLNVAVTRSLYYGAAYGSYNLVKQKSANGFIQHIVSGEFEGNILGMDNRDPGESAYDGDYNDILCLLETNPNYLQPAEEVTRPDILPTKVTEGYYLFEDNYPYKGDYDFNDVVIKYKITDYYTTSNKQKDVYVELVAKGAGFTNSFGFYDKGTKKYVTLIDNINGYANVDNTVAHSSLDKSVMVTFYGEIEPFLHNGTHHVMGTTINTNTYPWMLDMPLTGGFKWCAETHSIETVYPKYMDWRAGKVADGVWYTQYDSELVYKNAGK